MAEHTGHGTFINGSFRLGSGARWVTHNPARNFSEVFSTTSDPSLVDEAIAGARRAFTSWSAMDVAARIERLHRLRAVFDEMQVEMADAILRETGKPRREASGEAKALGARVTLMCETGLARVTTRTTSAGQERFHPQGVLVVLGPYNYPAHLVNAHVIPALLTGNTVVIKPSEYCLMTGELYARAAERAGLPPGVLQMMPGGADVGRALVAHADVDGVLFTGSYNTGRAITEACLDQPGKLLALEMGGKNAAVVLEDADLDQAAAGILQGAFLSAGQRCTATSRVLMASSIADALREKLVRGAARLRPGDPEDARAPFGPMANKPAFERFQSLRARAGGVASVLVAGEVLDGGAFVTPSVHERTKDQPASGYLDEELFGPDLLLEVIDDDDDAIARLQDSPYGLSNAVFTKAPARFERFYREVKSGLWNQNRSTNGASGLLPFGGVNNSGNQRPAGIAAVQYTTFPVAVMGAPFGQVAIDPTFADAVETSREDDVDVRVLVARHTIEGLLERHRLWPTPRGAALDVDAPIEVARQLADIVEPTATGFTVVVTEEIVAPLTAALDKAAKADLMRVNARRDLEVRTPSGGQLPRSTALMARMTRGDFVPKERKPAVVDHQKSEGPYLCSVDKAPLAILDAASQIASLGLGFAPREFLRLHDEGTLNEALLANIDTTAREDDTVSAYATFLTSRAGFDLEHATWASGGAEANERAFDLCRMNGPGGTRVIAFEGSFHGRTLASLFATSNPVKRKPFEIEGYEARFVPFPGWSDPRHEPSFDAAWVDSCRTGEPVAGDDELWQREAASIVALAAAIEEGDVCCVIMEPMQGEGGDQFVTSRFVHGLRALTRARGVPLVFDEVQTGLGLGGDLFWFHRFGLEDGPDCVTLAKKAQLGVCLSTWQDPRSAPAHVAQCARGLAHATAMVDYGATQGARDLASAVQSQLAALAVRFSGFIDNPRALALTFGFDLPSKHEANQVIAQRFYRGYMAYIAGERTVRFRLNHSWTSSTVESLFARLTDALAAVQRGGPAWKAPPWIDPAPVPAKAKSRALSLEQMRALAPLALERAADRWLLKHGEDGDDARTALALQHGARIIEIAPSDWPRFKDGVMAIENATYEDGRRETEAELKAMVDKEGAMSLLAVRGDDVVVGYAFGGPANTFTADGPREDPLRDDTFYSSNITVDPAARGAGIGLRFKREQARRASANYRYMSGRNRIGRTTGMGRVNRALGATGVDLFRGHQYGDLSGEALYYRCPLAGSQGPTSRVVKQSNLIDWASGVQAPLGLTSPDIQRALDRGAFRGPVGTKLTLSNFISAEVVRYAELLRALGPKGLPHAFFTSGRDELVDKGLRALRVKRPEARSLIGLEKQFLGTTTAAARSLTDPEGHAAPFSWFDFPRVPHPAEVGTDAFVGALMAAVQSLSPERVLGIVVEAVCERSGHVLDDDAKDALCALREDTRIPIVLVESASALGRTQETLWAADAWDKAPDHVWWYAGAQLGHIFTSDTYFVEKPLTLISTWDGDEISILRAREHLAVAYRASFARGDFAAAVRAAFPTARGSGLLQAVPTEDPKAVAARALDNNLVVHAGYGAVILTPALNSSSDEWSDGLARLSSAL